MTFKKVDEDEKRFTYTMNLLHKLIETLAEKGILTWQEATEMINDIDNKTQEYFKAIEELK